jgi:hypothetical protein
MVLNSTHCLEVNAKLLGAMHELWLNDLMQKAIAEFSLENGTKFLVEVDEPESTGGIERVAFGRRQVLKAQQTLEEALQRVKPVASTILTELKTGLTTPADEVEVKFGLKLTLDAGAIFTSIGSEVTYEITLKWKQDKGS